MFSYEVRSRLSARAKHAALNILYASASIKGIIFTGVEETSKILSVKCTSRGKNAKGHLDLVAISNIMG